MAVYYNTRGSITFTLNEASAALSSRLVTAFYHIVAETNDNGSTRTHVIDGGEWLTSEEIESFRKLLTDLGRHSKTVSVISIYAEGEGVDVENIMVGPADKVDRVDSSRKMENARKALAVLTQEQIITLLDALPWLEKS